MMNEEKIADSTVSNDISARKEPSPESKIDETPSDIIKATNGDDASAQIRVEQPTPKPVVKRHNVMPQQSRSVSVSALLNDLDGDSLKTPKTLSAKVKKTVIVQKSTPKEPKQKEALTVKKKSVVGISDMLTNQPMKTANEEQPRVVSRRDNASVKIPDWQSDLARCFLMAPDLSCTAKDVDMSDPANQTDANPETDQITEETTRCICCMPYESELMIQCDCCKKWLHQQPCVRLLDPKEVNPFICIYCQYEISRIVKNYARNYVFKKLSAFVPVLQRYQSKIPENTWKEMIEIIKDCQDVFQAIPMFVSPVEDQARNAQATEL